MKYFSKILTVLMFLCLIQKTTVGQSDCGDLLVHYWTKTGGGINDDEIKDIAVDLNGNIYITGLFKNNMIFQSSSVASYGGNDFFLAKLNPEGNLIWLKSGGGANDDYGTGVAVDSDGNIFVTGTFSGIAYVNDIVLYPNGNGSDIFLLKYSPDGNIIWNRKYGGNENDFSGGITIDNLNNVVFTGSFKSSIVIGSTAVFSLGATDHFTAKLDNDGNAIWVTNYGSVTDDFGIDLESDSNGNIFVIGEFSGTIFFGPLRLTAQGINDVFLVKLNSLGHAQWVKQAGSVGDNDKAGGVTVDNNRNVYFCYKKDQTINSAEIIKFDNAGTNPLYINMGGNNIVFPKDIAVDFSNNIYITGMYENSADFGNGPTVSIGGYDYFLAKYNPDGSFNNVIHSGTSNFDSGNAICTDGNNSIIVGLCSPATQGALDAVVIKYKKYFLFGDINIASINCDRNNMCISVGVIGGTEPITYNWSNGQSSNNICGISAGTYTLTATDASNCSIEKTIIIPNPAPPTITLPPSIQACPFDTITLAPGYGYDSYIWSTGETSQSINVVSSGNYSVTVTDSNSCYASAYTTISKSANINLLNNNDYYYCPNEFTNISVSGYQQYLWSNGSTNSNLITNIDGQYWLKVFNGTCYYYDTIQIHSYPQLSLSLGNDHTICQGDSVLVAPNNIFSTYLWHNNSTLNHFWAKEAGLVHVTVTDNNNCSNSDTININIVEVPAISLGNDTTVCTNSGFILQPTSLNHEYYDYYWFNGTTDLTSTIYLSGAYWVRATNTQGGCSTYDTINVTIHPELSISLGEDVEICRGDSVKLEISGNFVNILWSNGNNGNYIYAYGNQTISVLVKNIAGCQDSDTITITEHFVTTPFLGNDTTLCETDTYTLSPNDNYYNYSWSNGSSLPYFEVSRPGRYSLTVTDNYNCTANASILIDYKPKPIISNIDIDFGIVTVTANEGTPPYLYSLDNTYWQQENIFSNYPSNTYLVTVMDKNYCIAQSEIFLEITYKIPTFFTPNNDGYNDTWEIDGIINYPDAVVKIYDRYGKEIYEYKSGNRGWNGTYMGTNLPSDTYWYIIDFGKGKDVVKGSMTLKR